MFEILIVSLCTANNVCEEQSHSIPLKPYVCEWKKVEKYNELYFSGKAKDGKRIVAECKSVNVAVAKN